MSIICYKWGNANVLWKDGNWLWSECQIVQDILTGIGGNQPGVDATTLIQPWLIDPTNPYNSGEKKKRLIKLICKVKGIKYEEEKMMKDFKVTVDDVKLIVRTVSNVDLDVKLEE